MTLISSTLLDRVKSLDDLSRPDVILNQLDKLLESKLRLKENKTMEFGMDIGICSFSPIWYLWSWNSDLRRGQRRGRIFGKLKRRKIYGKIRAKC